MTSVQAKSWMKQFLPTIAVLTALAIPGLAESKNICSGDIVPAGWVITADFLNVNCPGFFTNPFNAFTITNENNALPRASVTVCTNSPIPPGWVVTGLATSGSCPPPGGVTPTNSRVLTNTNGIVLSTSITVCRESPPPVDPYWIVADITTFNSNCPIVGGWEDKVIYKFIFGEQNGAQELLCEGSSIPPNWVSLGPATGFNCGGHPNAIRNNNPTPTVTVNPPGATLLPFQSVQFSANVTVYPNTVTWSMSPQTGFLSPTGLYLAPASIPVAQTIFVRATNPSSGLFMDVPVNLIPYPAPPPPPAHLGFVPVTPCRLVDTRTNGGPIGAQWERDFSPIGSCGIPSSAQAYSLNITVVPQGPLGYLTVWPAGQNIPLVSTLNSPNGLVATNAALVPGGTSGNISVFVSNQTDVILDINGYFAPPTTQSLLFYPVTPCRLADTRTAGGPIGAQTKRTFPIAGSCNVPASAQAYSLNFTAVPQGPLGFLTTWATGQPQPPTSTLNSINGIVVANAAIVQAGTGGSVDAFAASTTDLIIDVNGYFAPAVAGGEFFNAVTPCRVVDTRTAGGAIAGNTARPIQMAGICGLPAAAANQSYSLNFTAIPSGTALGYLATWPAGQPQPLVSTLNSPLGLVVANAALVPAGGNGQINVFVSNTSDVVIDTNGYFAP